MPCNSDYMAPRDMEISLSRVACLLDELDGKQIDPTHWRGFHPKAYNKVMNGDGQAIDADALVDKLCARLRNSDVSKYSLEMQIWWRDHQNADKEKIAGEIQQKITEEEKLAALEKLTPYERQLLGLNNQERDDQ